MRSLNIQASTFLLFAGRSSKDAVGQISVHVDVTTTPGTGEHKVTVKGTPGVQIEHLTSTEIIRTLSVLSHTFF